MRACNRFFLGLDAVPVSSYCNYSLYFFCFFLLFLGDISFTSINGQLSSNCSNQLTCGKVNVPYPFTISGYDGPCPSFTLSKYPDTNFTLNCTHDVLYLYDVPVLNILSDSLIIDLSSFKATYNDTDRGCSLNVSSDPRFSQLGFYFDGPYVSAADNQFGSFGCSAGFLFTYQTQNATAYDTSGCEPFCGFTDNMSSTFFPNLNRSSYSGCGASLNCCISSFPAPARVSYYSIQKLSSDPSPCSSFAIPFHPNYSSFSSGMYGFKVLWALPDPHVFNQLKSMNSTASTFDVADLPDTLSTACYPGSSAQVIIVNEIVPGYRCSCLPGYQGDGYANGTGCVDINECSGNDTNECTVRAECRNTNGSYTCHCKSRWHAGDGMRNGTGCPVSSTVIKAVTITGGVVGVMLLLLSVVCCNILVDRRRKQRYFKQNGGFELQAYIAAETGRHTTRFFTAAELREATENFSEHLKLGTGGFGTVYRGTLQDGRVVAIKKANQPGDADRNQFLNELAILTQIHHKHIVRLHGCCLETANPLLVYEYVSNGDLGENLASDDMAMGWEERLQVGAQVADALAYLHSKSSPPILHRDVKSANLLLDGNLNAKVADFGISRLIPEGEKCVSTVVQGTLGYLDPEYFQTLQLTDKSDVYSLGVVLVELVTGLKAVDNHSREVKFANLALFFLEMMREERLPELMDVRLREAAHRRGPEAEWKLYTSIQNVAELARCCLALRGAQRPTMSELALKLVQFASAFRDGDEKGSQELRPLLYNSPLEGR